MTDIDECFTLTDINESFKKLSESIKIVVEAWEKVLKILYDACPNKRIVHLAKYSINPRVRKKNYNRILRGKW